MAVRVQQNTIRPGYKRAEVGVIPGDWQPKVIGDVVSFSGGSQPPRSTFSATRKTGYLRLIQIRDYKTDEFATYIPESLVHKRCLANDIMIGRYGPPIFQILRGLEGAYNVALIKAMPSALIDREYLFHFLKQDSLFRFVEALSQRSSGQTGIEMPALKTYGLPLPTLPEQRVIAAALSDADALITSLDNLIAKKRDLKQATMQQLLTGKEHLPGFSGKWGVKLFGALATPRKSRVDPRRSGVQEFCLELEHIDQGTGELLGSTVAGTQSSLKSVFQPRDVLFGKLRAYLRKYWLADRSGVCSTEIWVLTSNTEVMTPEFLFQIVQTDRFIEVASFAYGTHMPRSDWSLVKNYELAIPEPDEQAAIATILSDMDADIAALKARRDKTRALKQGMMQELLTGKTRLI